MAGYEAIGEVPPSSLGPEQEVPAVDAEIGATSTNFGASSIGQSLWTVASKKHDRGSRLMERGETSSGPSLQYVKRVLKSVLSSWIETLSSCHFEASLA